ncbi:MAG: hypothetical protein Q7R93_00545 [bacterium]|nr:hypothetical protein [bacterium]
MTEETHAFQEKTLEALPEELTFPEELKLLLENGLKENEAGIVSLVSQIREFVEVSKTLTIDGSYSFDEGAAGLSTRNARMLSKLISDMSAHLYQELYKHYETGTDSAKKVGNIDIDFKENCQVYIDQVGIKNVTTILALAGDRFDMDHMVDVSREERNRTSVVKPLSWEVRYSGRTFQHAKVEC